MLDEHDVRCVPALGCRRGGVCGVWRVRWRPSTAYETDIISLRKTKPLYEHRSMYRTLSLTEVGVYGEACV